MMFVLSSNPSIQQIQLAELLERSRKALLQLTSPVIVFDPSEVWNKYGMEMHGKNKTCQDYVPPATRFGRFSHFDPRR